MSSHPWTIGATATGRLSHREVGDTGAIARTCSAASTMDSRRGRTSVVVSEGTLVSGFRLLSCNAWSVG
jgi:hypothetical protein